MKKLILILFILPLFAFGQTYTGDKFNARVSIKTPKMFTGSDTVFVGKALYADSLRLKGVWGDTFGVTDTANATTPGLFTDFQYNKLQTISTATSSIKLTSFYSDVATSGTGETTLYSYTLPANTMNANGDVIEAIYYFTSTSTSATMKIYWGANYIQTATYNITTRYLVKITLTRVSSSVVRYFTESTISANQPILEYGEWTGIDFTTTNAIVIKATAANNAVTARSGLIIKY